MKSIWTLLALAIGLLGCFGTEPPPVATWPRQFRSFAFHTDLVVVFPGTCRVVSFSYDTEPPTRREELDLVVEGGSMRVHTVSPLEARDPTSTRLEGGGTWRVCAGDDAPVEGVIRVAFKDHPDYFAETRLVQRNFVERIRDLGPKLVLPTDAWYPTDARYSDDGDRLEVARGDGLVLHLDPRTGVVLRTENTLEGALRFLGDARALVYRDIHRQAFVDRLDKVVLSYFALWEFVDGSEDVGSIMYAHAAGRTLAVTGAARVGGGAAAFVSTYDLDEKVDAIHEYRFPNPENPAHFPHVVVAPNGRRIVWSGLGAPSMGALPDRRNEVTDLRTGESCSYIGTTILRGEILPVVIGLPAFSGDSRWFAHWATDVVPPRFSKHPLLVYDATDCTLRAFTEDTPPDFHRGAVALSSDGNVLAAVSGQEVRLYDVPKGVNQALVARATLAAIRTDDLHAGSQSAGFSDRQNLNRRHAYYPALRFSGDDRSLVSASSRGVRIFDLEDEYRAVETPVIDPDDYGIFGIYLRVGVPGAGALIYEIGTEARFRWQLGEGESFVGIDQYGVLVYRAGDRYFRRDLGAGTVEDAGASEPTWVAAQPMLTVTRTARGLEVSR